MAKRRMISSEIEDSHAFNSMSSGSQALYQKIVLHADDEGFRDDIETDMFQSHAIKADYDDLVGKGFILETANAEVKLVKHWVEANTIQKDHFKRSIYRDLEKPFFVKEDGSYTLTEAKAVSSMVGFYDENYPKTKETTLIPSEEKRMATKSCQNVDHIIFNSKEINSNINTEEGSKGDVMDEEILEKDTADKFKSAFKGGK